MKVVQALIQVAFFLPFFQEKPYNLFRLNFFLRFDFDYFLSSVHFLCQKEGKLSCGTVKVLISRNA